MDRHRLYAGFRFVRSCSTVRWRIGSAGSRAADRALPLCAVQHPGGPVALVRDDAGRPRSAGRRVRGFAGSGGFDCRDCYSGRRMARVMSLSFIVFLAVRLSHRASDSLSCWSRRGRSSSSVLRCSQSCDRLGLDQAAGNSASGGSAGDLVHTPFTHSKSCLPTASPSAIRWQ